MISSDMLAPPARRFLKTVLPTHRRRWRLDAGDIALPRREPRPPIIVIVGIVQATDVLRFDFAPPRDGRS